MNIVILLRYLHFISLFGVIACLIAQYFLFQKEMERAQIKKVAKIDGLYGLLALTVVAAGLTLWFGVGKPAEFYTKNPVFHVKIGLYIVVGLLSLYPTRFLWKHRKVKDEQLVKVPVRIKQVIALELAILFLIPLLAALMAQGVGL